MVRFAVMASCTLDDEPHRHGIFAAEPGRLAIGPGRVDPQPGRAVPAAGASAPALAAEAEQAAGGWPLLVPRPYLARIRPGDPADPLLLQVLPRAAELAAAAGYQADPLGEADAGCGPGLLRKYQGRILMVATGSCGVHCRFCFRRHFWHGNGRVPGDVGWMERGRRLAPASSPGTRGGVQSSGFRVQTAKISRSPNLQINAALTLTLSRREREQSQPSRRIARSTRSSSAAAIR